MPSSSISPTSSTGDRLREVAIELFAERGFAGASMSDIARRVGIRKPSLYNYYSSKEELYLDLLESSLSSWRDASEQALLQPGSFEERLHRHLRRTVEFTSDQPHAMAICRQALTQIFGELGARVRRRLLEERVDYQKLLESFFAAAIEAGEVISTSPEVLALAWLTFLDGVLFHQLFAVDNRSTYYREHLDRLWWLFWRGVASEPSSAPGAGV